MAVANLRRNRQRFAVTAVGLSVPLILLMMQIAFLQGTSKLVNRFYDSFDFDLVMVSSDYQFLVESGGFPRIRLNQALEVSEVSQTFGLNIQPALWRKKNSNQQTAILLFGLDSNETFVRDVEIRRGLRQLRDNRSVLVDAFALGDLGETAAGTQSKINGVDIEVSDNFHLGLFIYADGSAIVRNAAFPAFSRRDATAINIGLMKIAPDASAERTAERLRAVLPRDVQPLTREAFLQQETNFFVDTKPVGIIIHIGVAIAFVAGSMLQLQVVSTSIQNRIKEFATLKAMGFQPGFVFGVGVLEALLLAACAFALACAASALIFMAVRDSAHIPVGFTVQLIGITLSFTCATLVLSTASAIRRINRTDPAELY